MDWSANSWDSLESRQERRLLAMQQHSLDCLVSRMEMHSAMTKGMVTSMVPESLEILAWATKMETSLIRRIVLTVRSLVHRESCHWVVPKGTNRNNPEFGTVAKVS